MMKRCLVYWVRMVMGVLVFTVLWGCGSVPKKSQTVAAKISGKPSKQGKQGKGSGGYYQDDGPSDTIPAQLDAVADAVPRLEPIHKGTIKPYTVLGKEYVPEKTLKPFRQRGIASWYGRKFHGQLTANGERYDMFAMTAAHPTLPLPSYVRVTELVTGRSVVVRVNDRGPFYPGRIIDLSYTAAYKLGIVAGGTHWVEIEQVIPGEKSSQPETSVSAIATIKSPETPAAGASQMPSAVVSDEALFHAVSTPSGQKEIYIQLGAFAERSNAERFLEQIKVQLILLGEMVHLDLQEGFYRVQLGPYRSQDEAKQVAERVQEELQFEPSLKSR